MLSHYLMNVILVMKYVWHGWMTLQTTTCPQTTPQTCSVVTLDIGRKSLNNYPHQWCSGPRTMTQVWIWYLTISWVLYVSWSMSTRSGSPYRQLHDHKPHPRHDQLLPWKLETRAWIMDLISGVVVQRWWYSYVYGIPPFHECYMTCEPYLTGMDHLFRPHHDHKPHRDMLIYYTGYYNK